MQGFKPLISLSSNDDVVINFNERLGQWTYGALYKGYSRSLSKDVMVKVVDLKKFPLTKAHLDTEVNLLKKLQNNNYVVKFAEFKFYQNTLTLVTDICNHGNLREYLNKNGPLPEEKALHMLLQIIYGLRDLGELKYSHGAVRPENILLHEENGQIYPKLSNFIFAKPFNSESLSKTQLPYDSLYLAPEVLKGQKISPKSDLWSVGIMYYEMLYGITPWTGKTPKELDTNIQNIRIEFPVNEERPISETSVSFLQKVLERNLDKRAGWGDVMQHRLIFKGLFSKGDGTYRSMNEEFKEQTPSSRKLMYGMRREGTNKSIGTPSRAGTARLKERGTTFSRQSTIQDSEWGQKSLFQPDQDRSGFQQVLKTEEAGRFTAGAKTSRNPSITQGGKFSRQKSYESLAQGSKTQRSINNSGIKVYGNLLSKEGLAAPNHFHGNHRLDRPITAIGNGDKGFKAPFKELSYKAEMLGEIYELAVANKEYPLYEQIMKALDTEVQNMNNKVGDVLKLKDMFQEDMGSHVKSTATIMTVKSGALSARGTTASTTTVTRQKIDMAKKQKSKEIYELLKEMMANLLNFSNPAVCNEDILNIAANFKILREFNDIGENVARELENLKDILHTFYRKRHFDHLKYLLLVKNLV